VVVVVVVAGASGVLTNTHPREPIRHPGWIGTLVLLELVTGEVVVPELVSTVTEIGAVIQGHHAKYQPFATVAATVLPFAKLTVTAETSLPACPKM
jgi:hypothetical protein